MKKMLLLVLAVILCLSLVACGEKKVEEEIPSSVGNTSEVDMEPQIIVVESPEEEKEETVSGEISGEAAPTVELTSGEAAE